MKKFLTLVVCVTVVAVSIFASEKPTWVYSPATLNTSDRIYASGAGKQSTELLSIKAAKLEADYALASYISNSINGVVRSFAEEESSLLSGKTLESVSTFLTAMESRAKATLSMVRQEDVYKDEDGTVWVLVSMPLEIVLNQIGNGIKEITKEDSRNSEVMKKYASEIRTRSTETFEKVLSPSASSTEVVDNSTLDAPGVNTTSDSAVLEKVVDIAKSI